MILVSYWLSSLMYCPGDQESCRHSVDSQGSGGVPRKQMRVDHFSVATQHLDCGFDRHLYPSESFSSASSSKTEQVILKFLVLSLHFECFLSNNIKLVWK